MTTREKRKALELYRRAKREDEARELRSRRAGYGYGYSYHRDEHQALRRWNYAKREAVLSLRWFRAESAGLVGFAVLPDYYATEDDIFGDTYKPGIHGDSIPGGERRVEAEYKEALERLERDGANGIAGYYRLKPDGDCDGYGSRTFNDYLDIGHGDTREAERAGFELADSIFGFCGDDWKGSGCDLELMEQTLNALAEALRNRCATCRQPSPCRR